MVPRTSHFIAQRPPAATLLLLILLLAACGRPAPPPLEGPTFGDIPLLAGVTEIEGEVPLVLRTVAQAHQETIQEPRIGFYRTDNPFIDTIDQYDDALRRYGWSLIDVLEFGDGGFLRRYYRGEQRVIAAFHPAGEGADVVLMQGSIR